MANSKSTEAESIFNVTFDCPVCLDKLFPPVWQCKNGHMICDVCSTEDSVTTCPTCRIRSSPRERIQNLGVEKVIKLQYHPCPYSDGQCDKVLPYNLLESHKLDCKFAKLNVCAAMGLKCKETFCRDDLLDHLQKSHKVQVIKECSDTADKRNKTVSFNFTLPKRIQGYKLKKVFALEFPMESFPTVFVLMGIVEDKILKWTLNVVGSEYCAMRYHFEIIVGRMDDEIQVATPGSVFSLFKNSGNSTKSSSMKVEKCQRFTCELIIKRFPSLQDINESNAKDSAVELVYLTDSSDSLEEA